MTIPKAKEILDANIKAKPPGVNHDYFDALKLGSASFKRLLTMRSYGINQALMPLPGEDRQ